MVSCSCSYQVFTSRYSDQGWGFTGNSSILVQVYDPAEQRICFSTEFIVTHRRREYVKHFEKDSELLEVTGTGFLLRLVMMTAPYSGWSSCVYSCSFDYEYDEHRAALPLRQAFIEALRDEKCGPWRRSRLMVIGQGRAGKTATVRSLLNKS